MRRCRCSGYRKYHVYKWRHLWEKPFRLLRVFGPNEWAAALRRLPSGFSLSASFTFCDASQNVNDSFISCLFLCLVSKIQINSYLYTSSVHSFFLPFILYKIENKMHRRKALIFKLCHLSMIHYFINEWRGNYLLCSDPDVTCLSTPTWLCSGYKEHVPQIQTWWISYLQFLLFLYLSWATDVQPAYSLSWLIGF